MMDKKLHRLKENMDNTVLNNLDFRDKNMDVVRKVIYKSKKTDIFVHLYPRFLSLCITTLFILGIGYYSADKLGIIQKEEVSNVDSEGKQRNKVGAKKDIVTIQNVHDNQLEEYSITPSQYVVFDGYYYRMVAEVEQAKLGSQIGEVKRIGEWEIIKDGDSNTVTGPIYSIINKSPEEAIATKLWSNRDVYVLFERKEIVEQPDITKIYTTKNDPEEVQIAIQNVREKSSALYEFKDNERLELISVSFDPNHSSTVSLSYRVPEVDTTVQGFLSVMQYPKNKVPKHQNL